MLMMIVMDDNECMIVIDDIDGLWWSMMMLMMIVMMIYDSFSQWWWWRWWWLFMSLMVLLIDMLYLVLIFILSLPTYYLASTKIVKWIHSIIFFNYDATYCKCNLKRNAGALFHILFKFLCFESELTYKIRSKVNLRTSCCKTHSSSESVINLQ